MKKRCGSILWGIWLFSGSVIASTPLNVFTLVSWHSPDGLRIEGRIETNRLITLETSVDLHTWQPRAVLDQRIYHEDSFYQAFAISNHFSFLDQNTTATAFRFYRFQTTPLSETQDCKNQVYFPNDGYASEPPGSESGRVRWIKFAILLDQPDRVYYQDSQKYLLHHEFATNRFERFHGLSPVEYDRISLYVTNQQVLLGTVLLPPREDLLEYGVQFSCRDPLPRDMAVQYLDLVRSTIVSPQGTKLLYLPSFEQSESAAAAEAFFAEHGIRVSTINRWLSGNQVYAQGWALGRLVFVTAGQIADAYRTGTLRSQDILLTDGVPAEVPQVAGIVSTVPATPNSHVAILASTFGVPFVYLSDSNLLEQARQLAGNEIIIQAQVQSDFGLISIIPVEGNLDAALRQELLDLKKPAPVQITPKARYGSYSANTDPMSYSDIKFFGGKAAQFGYLRRAAPTNSPRAIAFSFDLWDDFMGQVLPNGRALGLEISNRLAAFSYPPDIATLGAELQAVRDLITQTAQFSSEQQQVILGALSEFDPGRKIRFRSSSNAEDSQTFAAAGLYDSYSGCLADDLDSDNTGPCRCDSAEAKERGVFRAMKKVYASFYNDNAFLERLRHGIDESQVGMALLAHYSTPDEQELANGVATVAIENSGFFSEIKARLVTQLGAVSVTNPEGNAKPEVVDISESGAPNLVQSSSLVPWGSHVLEWEDEYKQLMDILSSVFKTYQASTTQKSGDPDLVLDFEYKKVKPGQLMLKQVRSLPQPGGAQTTPYILGQSATFWTYQREGSDVYANHRLKCQINLVPFNGQLNESNLVKGLYTEARLSLHQGTQTVVLTGPPSSWPNARHQVIRDEDLGWQVSDFWTVGEGPGLWRFELLSTVPFQKSVQAPFLTLPEIRKRLRVEYTTPQPAYLEWQQQAIMVTNEETKLVQCPDLSTLLPGEATRLTNAAGLQIEFSFLVSTNETGPSVDEDKNFWGFYMASLSPWAHATITGLLDSPIVLSNYFATSASPGHKMLQNWILFEPRLDPGVAEAQLRELEARNIQAIAVKYGLLIQKNTVLFLGLDGRIWEPKNTQQ